MKMKLLSSKYFHALHQIFVKPLYVSLIPCSFEDATYHCEHSNFDLNYVGKFALSEVTRDRGFNVVLTGEGADEHFAGYIPLIAEYLREPDTAWPQSILSSNDGLRRELFEERDAASQKFYNDFGATDGEQTLSRRWQLNNTAINSAFLLFRPSVAMFSPWVHSLYHRLDPRDTVTNNVDGRIKELIRTKWHPLHSSLYIWSRSALVNNLLSCLGDRVEMAHSVEARTPFLDHHLTEYVNAIPPSLKVRCEIGGGGANGLYANGDNNQDASVSCDLTEKWILRQAAQPFITDEIYRRRKHPYTAPATYPANGPLHKLMQTILTKENVDTLGFLNWDAVTLHMEQAFPDSGKQAPSTHALRAVFMGAQWVVLGRRFGVASASS